MNNYKYLLTIIIPYYNCSDFISRIIYNVENCLNQGFQIIIINDGSKENETQILYSNLEKYKNSIEIISQENLGANEARRTGLSYAKGKFVLFLDSDDCILTKSTIMLKVILNNYYSNNIFLINYISTYSKNIPLELDENINIFNYKNYQCIKPLEIILSLTLGHYKFKIAPSQIIMSKDIALKTLKYGNLTWAEDLPWLYRIAFTEKLNCLRLDNCYVSRWFGNTSRGYNYKYKEIISLTKEVFYKLDNISKFKRFVLSILLLFRYTLSYIYKYVYKSLRWNWQYTLSNSIFKKN